jgi:Zn-dependent peptidase ImmA (M78 family)
VSKVKPLLPVPVAAARRVLAECDVRHPRDICIEPIAARYGAIVVYGPIATARGAIVRTSERAVIWVDEKAKGEPRARFTAAHELGHHLLHDVVDHFAQCHGEDAAPPKGSAEGRDADKKTRAVEKEADHFSTEITMPEAWGAPLCEVCRPTLDDVFRLVRTFRMSFQASAIRFVELTAAPCAFVHTVRGRIKRSTETEAFPGTIVQRRAVHADSLAAGLQDRRAGSGPDGEPREVPGAAWGDDRRGRSFLEYTIALGPEIGVMSWVVPTE